MESDVGDVMLHDDIVESTCSDVIANLLTAYYTPTPVISQASIIAHLKTL